MLTERTKHSNEPVQRYSENNWSVKLLISIDIMNLPWASHKATCTDACVCEGMQGRLGTGDFIII